MVATVVQSPARRARSIPRLGAVPCPWCGDFVLWVRWRNPRPPAPVRRRAGQPVKDMTGVRVGRLVVIERVVAGGERQARWRCRCDCGTEVVIAGGSLRVALRSGTHAARSCGCLKRDRHLSAMLATMADPALARPRRSGVQPADLTGQRFGRLVAAEQVPRPAGKTYGTWWRCDCDCGESTFCVANSLRNGATRSCGCLAREHAATLAARRATTRGVGRDPRPPELVALRPVTRGDCAGGERPCPWVSCRHHLYLDVAADGRVAVMGTGEPWEMAQTCALDVAEQGPQTLDLIGALLEVSRERIRQIETKALDNARGETRDADLEDWRATR